MPLTWWSKEAHITAPGELMRGARILKVNTTGDVFALVSLRVTTEVPVILIVFTYVSHSLDCFSFLFFSSLFKCIQV